MKRRIAKDLLRIKAVFLRPEEPFIWASGIKSPIYCDNRLTLSYPGVRSDVEFTLAKLIGEQYPDAEMIMGTSTAGIAHAAIVAHILNLPMGYVRSSKKDHGRNNRIEGKLDPGMKCVIVEDLISTAKSAIDVALTLREAGAEVLGIASIFTYDMTKSSNLLKEHNLINHSATDYDTLIEVAVEEGYITPEQKEKLISFRNNPEDESWIK